MNFDVEEKKQSLHKNMIPVEASYRYFLRIPLHDLPQKGLG